jgi:hypothetical protein
MLLLVDDSILICRSTLASAMFLKMEVDRIGGELRARRLLFNRLPRLL